MSEKDIQEPLDKKDLDSPTFIFLHNTYPESVGTVNAVTRFFNPQGKDASIAAAAAVEAVASAKFVAQNSIFADSHQLTNVDHSSKTKCCNIVNTVTRIFNPQGKDASRAAAAASRKDLMSSGSQPFPSMDCTLPPNPETMDDTIIETRDFESDEEKATVAVTKLVKSASKMAKAATKLVEAAEEENGCRDVKKDAMAAKFARKDVMSSRFHPFISLDYTMDDAIIDVENLSSDGGTHGRDF